MKRHISIPGLLLLAFTLAWAPAGISSCVNPDQVLSDQQQLLESFHGAADEHKRLKCPSLVAATVPSPRCEQIRRCLLDAYQAEHDCGTEMHLISISAIKAEVDAAAATCKTGRDHALALCRQPPRPPALPAARFGPAPSDGGPDHGR